MEQREWEEVAAANCHRTTVVKHFVIGHETNEDFEGNFPTTLNPQYFINQCRTNNNVFTVTENTQSLSVLISLSLCACVCACFRVNFA